MINNNSYSNENLSNLNNLYLNGVLDRESYFKSLNNLGLDTSNDIFLNLFELFSNKVLDLDSYENSIDNLLAMSNKAISNSVSSNTKTKASIEKNYAYKVVNCKGDSNTCKILNSEIINFKDEDDEIKISQSDLDSLINDEPELIKVDMIKTFKKNDNFDIVVTIRHVQGILLDFAFKGFKKDNDFKMTDLSLKANGREISSAELVKNN